MRKPCAEVDRFLRLILVGFILDALRGGGEADAKEEKKKRSLELNLTARQFGAGSKSGGLRAQSVKKVMALGSGPKVSA